MADLSISYQREQVVDFSMPFLDLGISLLYVNAPAKSVNLFSFLSPFSLNVWLLMLLAGFLVSLAMYFIARYINNNNIYSYLKNMVPILAL